MPNIIRCGNPNCDYTSPVNDIDPESGKQKPCPKCGSLKRIIDMEEIKEGLSVGARIGGEHETHLSAVSWTIFALILSLVVTLISYAVFSIPTLFFWYKLLIWLGIILVPFLLAYKYRLIWYKIIILLRYIENNTYGKHKI